MEDTINYNSPEFSELIQKVAETGNLLDRIGRYTRPMLGGERYLTTEEVCGMLHICKRALQNYRDRGIIPHITLGRVILYPESGVKKALEKNYYKPTVGNNPK